MSTPRAKLAQEAATLCLEAASHWEMQVRVMDEEIGVRLAMDRGADIDVAYRQMKVYRRTAQALRMEAADGLPRCSCCILPLDRCHMNPAISRRVRFKEGG